MNLLWGMMMTDDLVKQLRESAVGWDDLGFHVDAKRDRDAADEIERLTKKCDMQAMILRRLTPENHPDTLFIHGTLGDKDHNNMPEKLQVVPAYGVDFSYIYERTEKITGPEW
jgi:hypothetical protein